MFYTSDTLITSVKDRTLAPSSQTTFSSATFLNFANEEMQIKMVPYIMSMREDFFLKNLSQAITANISKYTLPRRAIGNGIKDLFVIDNTNNRFIVPKINIHDLPITGSISDLFISHFYLYGDQIVVTPTPNTTAGSLDIWYYSKPSQLVLTSACAKITAVSQGSPNTIFTVDTDISAQTTVDFLSGKSPFQLWVQDIPVVSATATTVTILTTNVDDEAMSLVLPQVGDYICPQLQANIPMIPEEFHPLLAELVAARVLQALGDGAKLQQTMANIAEMKMNIQMLMANRAEQAVEKIVNRYSLDRVSGMGYRTGFFR